MVVDTDANLAIVEIMKGRNESIIDGIWVEKINSHHRKDHRLLVLTESSASLCRAKKASKIVTISRSYQWFSITSVDCATPKVISLKFGAGEDLTFVCHSHTVILEHILAHLKDILHRSEMPTINCPGFNVDAILSSRNPLAALKRLRAKVFCRATLMPDDLDEKFQQVLLQNTEELNMGWIPYGNFCSEVLDAVSVEERIKSVVFPKGDVTHWREVAVFLATAKGVRRFETMERMDSTFAAMGEATKWDSSIEELSLGCQKAGEQELRIITDLCIREGLRCLEIHGGLNSKQASELCRSLKGSCLKCLKLDGVESLDITNDFGCLMSFECVSLTNCQIEVSDLFSLMTDGDLRVTSLDLSMNKFQKQMPRNWRLPVSLQSLTLDNIETSIQVFGPFLRMILRSEFPLLLSVKNLDLGPAQTPDLLDGVYAKLTSLKDGEPFRIAELYWDGNLVCPSFFQLMDRCSPLNVLSLKDVVFSDTDVSDLAQFMANTCSVQRLIVSGSHNQILPVSAITCFVNALRTNRSITSIDISWTERSDAFLSNLADILMQNRLINTLIMKDKPFDEASLKLFLNKLTMRGARLYIQVASCDKYDMEAKALLHTIAKGNASITIPPESLKRTKKPVKCSYTVERSDVAHRSRKEHISGTPPAVPRPVPHHSRHSPFPEVDEYIWRLPPVHRLPPIDNTKLLQQFATEFSIHNIFARMRKR